MYTVGRLSVERLPKRRGRFSIRSSVITFAALALVLILARCRLAPAAEVSAAPKLFAKYCYDCHGDGEKSGQIALDEMLKADSPTPRRREWEKAWKIVRQEFMPPVDAERPSAEERKAITQWIEQNALGIDYQNPDPGRVTMRRLNRMEYEFSLTDLFGLNLTQTLMHASDG